MRNSLRICCLALLGLMLILIAPAHADYARFDASALQDESSENLVLRGDWMFAWGRFLSPSEARQAFVSRHYPSIDVPSDWRDNDLISDRPPDGNGIATYVSALTLPETPRDALLLQIGLIHDAYRILWVPLDDSTSATLLAEEGHLEGPSRPARRAQSHALPVAGEGLLVIHVRKDLFDWGGITTAPYVTFGKKAATSAYLKALWGGITIGALDRKSTRLNSSH